MSNRTELRVSTVLFQIQQNWNDFWSNEKSREVMSTRQNWRLSIYLFHFSENWDDFQSPDTSCGIKSNRTELN